MATTIHVQEGDSCDECPLVAHEEVSDRQIYRIAARLRASGELIKSPQRRPAYDVAALRAEL